MDVAKELPTRTLTGLDPLANPPRNADDEKFFTACIEDITQHVLNNWFSVKLEFAKPPDTHYASITSGIPDLISSGVSAGITALITATCPPLVFFAAPLAGAAGFAAKKGAEQLFKKLDPAKDIPEHLCLEMQNQRVHTSLNVREFAAKLFSIYSTQIYQLDQRGMFDLASVMCIRAIFYIGLHKKPLNTETLLEGVQFGFSGGEWTNSWENALVGTSFTNRKLSTKKLKEDAWTAEGLISRPLVRIDGGLWSYGEPHTTKDGMPKYGIRKCSDADRKVFDSKNIEFHSNYRKNYNIFDRPVLMTRLIRYVNYELQVSAPITVKQEWIKAYLILNCYANYKHNATISLREFCIFLYRNENNDNYKKLYKKLLEQINSRKPNDIDEDVKEANYTSFQDFKAKDLPDIKTQYNISLKEKSVLAIGTDYDSFYRNADFSCLDLSLLNFDELNLTNANFSGSNISCSFKGAILNSANLVGVTAKGAKFTNASIEGADLSGGEFSDADFSGADLRDIIYIGARLDRVNINQAKTSRKIIEYIGQRTEERLLEEYQHQKYRAEYYYDREDYMAAILEFNICLQNTKSQDNAESSEILIKQGDCFYRQKDYDAARANFNHVLIINESAFKSVSQEDEHVIEHDERTIESSLNYVDALIRINFIKLVESDNLKDDVEKIKICKEVYGNLYNLDSSFLKIVKGTQTVKLKEKQMQRLSQLFYCFGNVCLRLGKLDKSNQIKYFKQSVINFDQAAKCYGALLGNKFTRSSARALNNLADGLENLAGVLSEPDESKESLRPQRVLETLKTDGAKVIIEIPNNINEVYQLALKYIKDALEKKENAALSETTKPDAAKHKQQILTKEEQGYFYLNKGLLQLKMGLVSSDETSREKFYLNAADSLRESTRQMPKYVVAWHFYALTFTALAQYAAALNILKTARALTNDDPCIMVDYAICVLRKVQKLIPVANSSVSVERNLQKAKACLSRADEEIGKQLKLETDQRDIPSEAYELVLRLQGIKAKFFLDAKIAEEDKAFVQKNALLKPLLDCELETPQKQLVDLKLGK